MNNKEVEKVLEELQEVRAEKLTGEAKRLFEAIMIIANARDKAEADLYEANKRIADLLLILGDRDRIIDLMADDLVDDEKYIEDLADFEYFPEYKTKEEAIKYFEERCKNAKD